MSMAFCVFAGAAIGFILGTVVGRWLFRPQPLERRLLLKTWRKISRPKMRRFMRRIPYAHDVSDNITLNLKHIGSDFEL